MTAHAKQPKTRSAASRHHSRKTLAGRAAGFLLIAQDLITAARDLSESVDDVDRSLERSERAIWSALRALTSHKPG